LQITGYISANTLPVENNKHAPYNDRKTVIPLYTKNTSQYTERYTYCFKITVLTLQRKHYNRKITNTLQEVLKGAR
jgi:hypothetical protein